MNLISPIASALSIMFLHLIIDLFLLKNFIKKNTTIYYAAFIGALTFAVIILIGLMQLKQKYMPYLHYLLQLWYG